MASNTETWRAALMQKYQITLSAELESLAKFRDFIKQTALQAIQQGQPINESTVYDLQLAVDEAATNIIQHGYAGIDPGSIILEIFIKQGQVIMTLTDFGYQFEPANAPVPDIQAGLEDRPMGGFGLFFIYQSMDEVSYEADPCGNRLILMKNLP